ncbi:MAG: IS66 family transposase, partial [Planctomycetota bacterium]
QADAYSGYDALFRRDDVVEVGCWAHARRYFYQALQGQVEEAAPAMASIRRLYQLEKELQDRSPEERRQLRQDKAKPILENLKAKLKLEQSLVLPKSSYGKAIGYALRHWEALNRYLEDGDLTIDNNACEREIRSVAIGRKNWLFAGSKAGGERAAILYSIIQTCRACKVEPWAYLKDVLSKIHTTPKEKIAELTPRAWKRNKD